MSISSLVSGQQDIARSALLESSPKEHVGDFIDFNINEESDEVVVATYNFVNTSPSYPGWYWSVLVVAIAGQAHCTVSEINLLPGPDALMPPAWKPWAERIQAGDLGVGDLLPPPENDVRLTAGFTGLDEFSEDLAPLHPVQWELGLGREKILSTVGQDQAVQRWMAGQSGPRSAMAKSAPASCSTCGYLVAIGGSLGQSFGICANELGAADGQIVAMGFGCGAHSSVVVKQSAPVPIVELIVDDIEDVQSPVEDTKKFETDIEEVDADTQTPDFEEAHLDSTTSVSNDEIEVSGDEKTADFAEEPDETFEQSQETD